jgi:hypothetical protein
VSLNLSGLSQDKLLAMKAEIFVAVLLLSASTRLAAQSPTGDERQVENAAVKYLRADASLRQSYPLVPDATAALRG